MLAGEQLPESVSALLLIIGPFLEWRQTPKGIIHCMSSLMHIIGLIRGFIFYHPFVPRTYR